MSFIPSAGFGASSFSLFQRSMMRQEELPLAEVLDDARWEEALAEHGVEFGEEDAVYTPAITLWALVSQVFFAAEQRSCQAAVVRVAALWAVLGRRVCATNTGAYCRARLKIPCEAVRAIIRQLAEAKGQAVMFAFRQNFADLWRISCPLGACPSTRQVAESSVAPRAARRLGLGSLGNGGVGAP